ncbi:hypothetical protein LCGC14_1349460, partial [marine sediment metagenome]
MPVIFAKSATGTGLTSSDIDHGNVTGLDDNDHTQYVTGVSGSTPLRGGGQILGFDETAVDHDNLTNYVIGQHRVINDVGMSATELWSASQIESRVVTATGSLTTDHGALTGLSDDDHTQYFLADSSRAFSGDLLPNVSGTIDIGSLALPFRSIYLTGSSLYMDGNKILFTDGDNIVLASPDGSIVISGSVNLSDAVVYHADLTGLGNDDHSQYHTNARGDARYYTETEVDTWRNSVTQTEMGYVDGVTSDIQTQIDAKLAIATFTVSSGDLQTNIDALTHDGFADYVADEHFTEASIDHGSISGLLDDDHPQYINDTEMTTISGDLQNGVDNNTTAIALNTTHRSSDGSDHSIVGTNTTAITANTNLITTVSGDLSNEIDVDISTHNVADNHIAHSTVSISSGGILSGGGTIDSNQTITLANADIDHGGISGLADDDHTQYILADGTRHAVSLIIDGNLIVSGTQFIANVETVLIEDNLLVINNGEVGAGVTEGEAGIEVDRGSETNYRFMFNESNDYFVVGISGSEQPVATRQTSPTNSGVAYWDGTNNKFLTDAGFIYTGGNLRSTAAAPLNIADLTRKDYVDAEIDGDISTHESGSSHDGRYYTETELDAGQLDNRYHTESEITTISGDLQSNIDNLTHDGFADYVTNEHIDWTADAGGDNIHDNNIVSASVTQHEGDIDHSNIAGLGNDDHTQYTLVDGTRAFTGNIQANASGTLDIGASSAPFANIYADTLYGDGNNITNIDGDNVVMARIAGSTYSTS